MRIHPLNVLVFNLARLLAAGSSETSHDDGSGWMNAGGPPYRIMNSDSFDTEWILKDPSVSSFDVYSKPIRSTYSQVHWISHGSIPLPEEIEDRYGQANSVTDTMAVVGYEVDQVRMDSETGREISVPITWAYNHHYMVALLGSRSAKNADGTIEEIPTKLVERPVTESMKRAGIGHGAETMWIPDSFSTNLEENDRSWIFLSEGNGGEMRKSYHTYPRKYGQLIRKPHSFHVTPMQIDTWNRDLMANTSRFVPPINPDDYLPKSSRIRDLKMANYNPLLECPCSDRLPKTWGMTYSLKNLDPNKNHIVLDIDHSENREKDDGKGPRLENSTECFAAALQLLPSTNVTNRIVPKSSPVHKNNQNTDTNTGICTAIVRDDASLEVVWDETANEEEKDMNDPNTAILVGTTPVGSIINTTFIWDATSGRVEITMKGPFLEDGDDDDRWFAIGLGADSMCLNMEADECPTGGPYAIVVLPASANMTSRVLERKLDYHGAGKILVSDSEEYELTVLYNEIEFEDEKAENGQDNGVLEFGPGKQITTGTVRVGRKDEEEVPRSNNRDSRRRRRVVRLSRPLKGSNSDYYSFRDDPNKPNPLKVILATGCRGSSAFGRHCGHQSPDPLVFARVGYWQEILRNGIRGRIGGKPFSKNCLDEPYGDLVQQDNPTCTVQSYQGGLSCCVHDEFLLDYNQTIPWKDQVLEYRLKFRFYFQDYIEQKQREGVGHSTAAAMLDKNSVASHQDMVRFYWTTEAGAGEYDVPECNSESPPSQCVHVITSRWKVRDFLDFNDEKTKQLKGIELVYAGPHCHAPECLSMELYNADTGKLLCSMQPDFGKGRRNESTLGGFFEGEEKYDEEGFIAIPPCMWSSHNDSTENLPRPDFLSLDTKLLSIKRTNSTFPHTGEMASWQMRGIVIRKDPEVEDGAVPSNEENVISDHVDDDHEYLRK